MRRPANHEMTEPTAIFADWLHRDDKGRMVLNLPGSKRSLAELPHLTDGMTVTLNVDDDFLCRATLVLDEDAHHGRCWRAIPDLNTIGSPPNERPSRCA